MAKTLPVLAGISSFVNLSRGQRCTVPYCRRCPSHRVDCQMMQPSRIMLWLSHKAEDSGSGGRSKPHHVCSRAARRMVQDFSITACHSAHS
ncbi:hypothetical protein BJ166DRAFT_515340 [Pestalotiopsis sp. NC0098]|nr:hypothetical protein BJ166DRAFT_515340 [Pestalotiopsis sp. NC0098]